MQPIIVGALLALSAHQTDAMWGPNTWWGWGPSGTATATARTAPAAKNWGWNWGSSWGVKPANAHLWGSCPQGQWQWRTGCRAIPECAPGQAWKGWAAGCCKNDCPINQTWDPRTGRCCAVPTCPAGQGWKGWARGCCADTTASASRPATKPALVRPVPAPVAASVADRDLTVDDVEVVDVDDAAPPVVAPLPIQAPVTAPVAASAGEEDVNFEGENKFIDEPQGVEGEQDLFIDEPQGVEGEQDLLLDGEVEPSVGEGADA